MSKGPGHGGGRGDAGRAKEIGGFQIGGHVQRGGKKTNTYLVLARYAFHSFHSMRLFNTETMRVM